MEPNPTHLLDEYYRCWVGADLRRYLPVAAITWGGKYVWLWPPENLKIENLNPLCGGTIGYKMTDSDNYNIKLERWTGLKDRGGGKIYEGDVVCDYRDYEEVGYISFEEGSYCVNWLINSEKLDGDLADSLVIIGNVHETKLRGVRQ